LDFQQALHWCSYIHCVLHKLNSWHRKQISEHTIVRY